MLKNCKTFNKITNTNMTKNDDIWQHFPAADKEIHTNFFMESLCQIIIHFTIRNNIILIYLEIESYACVIIR